VPDIQLEPVVAAAARWGGAVRGKVFSFPAISLAWALVELSRKIANGEPKMADPVRQLEKALLKKGIRDVMVVSSKRSGEVDPPDIFLAWMTGEQCHLEGDNLMLAIEASDGTSASLLAECRKRE
jgi:hypothetical protein